MISFKEAKRLAIKKWKMHVQEFGDSEAVYDDSELKCLQFNCGFCERWKDDCSRCEFGKVAGICTEDDSLFCIWSDDINVENAEAILNVITNLEE